MVAVRGRSVQILDVQIVSGSRNLFLLHIDKSDYYARSLDFKKIVDAENDVPAQEVVVNPIITYWREIWYPENYDVLHSSNLSTRQISRLTTKVLFGTYINFKRLNDAASHTRPSKRRTAEVSGRHLHSQPSTASHLENMAHRTILQRSPRNRRSLYQIPEIEAKRLCHRKKDSSTCPRVTNSENPYFPSYKRSKIRLLTDQTPTIYW